nr:transposase [Sinorhizobium medicae]
MVQETLKRDQMSGHLFVFRGRSGQLPTFLHTVFVLRRSHILGIRCSGERCRSRRIGAARA